MLSLRKELHIQFKKFRKYETRFKNIKFILIFKAIKY